MLDIEPSEEAHPAAVNVLAGGIDVRPPQPYWFRLPTGWQVVDGQANDGPFDDRQVTEAVSPGGPVGQDRM
ncbi:hypothetical protein ABIA35_006779 [Catenulispora sp. MAP12-49]